MKGVDLPDWPEFKGLSRTYIKSKYDLAQSTRKIRESLPDWLDQLGEEELGDSWEATVKALNETAPLTIRINTIKTSLPALLLFCQGRSKVDQN
ncbi:MAG: hypothetical protein IPH36_16785 [Saprospiraceae bacterium]|nr:hypothetical protein [Saprospiraceae bacterium]